MPVRTLDDAKKRITRLSRSQKGENIVSTPSDAFRNNYDGIKWPDRTHPEHDAGVHIPAKDETRICGDCRNYITHTGNDAHGVCQNTNTPLPWYNVTCVKYAERKLSPAFLGP